MGIVYVAASKLQQEWGADVGIGKNLYKVGWVEEEPVEDAVMGVADYPDWVVVAQAPGDGPQEAVIARVALKEKMVDPKYYPRLRGTVGVFKVAADKLENSLIVAMALENIAAPKGFKVTPADIAKSLLRAAGAQMASEAPATDAPTEAPTEAP